MSVYLFTYLFECISLTLDISITYIVIKYILVFKCIKIILYNQVNHYVIS